MADRADMGYMNIHGQLESSLLQGSQKQKRYATTANRCLVVALSEAHK